MTTLDKRLEKLETGKERKEFEPLHLYRYGAARVSDRTYYVGEDDFVIVHEAQEVPE